MFKHLVCLLFLCLGPVARAAVVVPVAAQEAAVVTVPQRGRPTKEQFRAALEAQLGRKLSFVERILLGKARRKARRTNQDFGDPGNGLLITGFVLGLMSLLLLIFTLTCIPLAVAGIIFSWAGRKKAKREGRPLKALGTLGIVFGSIVLSVYLAAFIALVLI